MFLKKTIAPLFLTCFALSFSTALQAASDQTSGEAIAFPQGNKVNGKMTFENFGCIHCHGINLEGKTGLAPSLQLDPSVSDETIVASIISPSHRIASGFGKGDPEDVQTSGMPELWREMTVQELVDIVAYLKPNREEES